jgi:hypothetical protein
VERVVSEALVAAFEDLGVHEAAAWADGYRIPPEMVDEDLAALAHQAGSFFAMVRARIAGLAPDRLSLERIDRLTTRSSTAVAANVAAAPSAADAVGAADIAAAAAAAGTARAASTAGQANAADVADAAAAAEAAGAADAAQRTQQRRQLMQQTLQTQQPR